MTLPVTGSGFDWPRYVINTNVPADRGASVTPRSSKHRVDDATRGTSSRLTDATVGAADAAASVMSIVFSLSVKDTSRVPSVRAQPSGTFTVYVDGPGEYATNAWSSG